MFTSNKLAMAVRCAALGMAAASTLVVPAVNAAEEGATVNAERIAVTGSRIKRTDLETSTPVSIITAEDIKLSGLDNIADVIRNSSFNTLGSYREQSGSSFGGAALVNLRGLGSDRTAVLINGRRLPGSPFTGTSAADISTIPMAAVKSIEILTDSASAVYGADAIGGVINIIMKDDYDGTVVEYNTEIPDRDGGDRDSFTLTTGSTNDKGSVLFSYEYDKKAGIYDRDRSYSGLGFLSDAEIPTDGVDVVGANGGGNSGFSMDFSSAFAVGECDESFYLPMKDPFGVPGTGCGYIYSDISKMTMDIERHSTFLTARRNLNDNHEVYLENRVSIKETSGRFAPAIGGFLVAGDADLNPIGEDFILYHRFVAHGPRDDEAKGVEFDTVVGLQGTLSDLIGLEVDYDLSVRKYKSAITELGHNYVLQSNIEAAVADGSYNFLDPLSDDEKHQAAIASTKATLTRDLENETTAVQLTLNGDTDFELSGGPVQWAAGFEYSEEEYKDKYDAYREAENVLGSSGNSAAGGRERSAAYAEVLLPVIEDLDVNVAVRFDDYSDFGSEVSPSISASYQVTDFLKLRASWGEGFKAPNLTDLYSKPAQSFEGIIDTTRCRAMGVADADCSSAQQETFNAGNTDLVAETSTSYNFGLILEPIEDSVITVDYYSVELDGVVTQLEFADVFELEQKGQLPPGVIVNRAPSEGGVPGAITRCVTESYPNCGLINPVANLASRKVEGVDLKFGYTLATSFGEFSPELSWSHIITYEDELLGVVFDQPGTEGFPENRANFNLNWALNDLSVYYGFQWISETDADSTGVFPAWKHHTINMIWSGIDGVELTAGIRNFTDEDPSIDTVAGWTAGTSSTSLDLYSIDGRVYTAGIKVSF